MPDSDEEPVLVNIARGWTWRGEFYAHYYGMREIIEHTKPDHVFDPCEPPEVFWERLYRGDESGYRKVVDFEHRGERTVIFNSTSGEWRLYGKEESG